MSEQTTKRLILAAAELKPGDFVSEYDATVTSVGTSAHFGVREVTFDGDPLTRYLHFLEWLHVERPVSGDGEEHQDQDQPDAEPATWDDDSGIWLCRPAAPVRVVVPRIRQFSRAAGATLSLSARTQQGTRRARYGTG